MECHKMPQNDTFSAPLLHTYFCTRISQYNRFRIPPIPTCTCHPIAPSMQETRSNRFRQALEPCSFWSFHALLFHLKGGQEDQNGVEFNRGVSPPETPGIALTYLDTPPLVRSHEAIVERSRHFPKSLRDSVRSGSQNQSLSLYRSFSN